MNYLKVGCLLWCFLLVSCANNNESAASNTDKKETAEAEKIKANRVGFQKTEQGMFYKIHIANEGVKAKLNDFLIADLSYATEGGYNIFAKKDLAFSFSQQLFGGAINEGLEMMSKGDSATFIIPVNKIYRQKIPNFVKEGEGIVFQIKLSDILDEKAYKQQMRVRSQSSKPS